MFRPLIVFSCLLLSGPMPAHGVVVQGGDGTQQTTPAGAGPGWDYVGSLNGASGIFLGDYEGDYWVMTAGHVGAGVFTLAGVAYNPVAGSAVVVTNDAGEPLDLVLFKIGAAPLLPNLTLSGAAPPTGSSLKLIGNGRNRESAETFWTPAWTETTNPIFGTNKGYKWIGSSSMRWGDSTVSRTGTYSVTPGATSNAALVTAFARASGSTQATLGDSGGGVFFTNGLTLELAGVMGAVSTEVGQPGETSVYGNETFSVNIAQYHNRITAITGAPEPGAASMLISALAMLTARRRRRRN